MRRRELVDHLPPRLAIPLRAHLRADPESAVLARFVGLGDTVVDVGANKGLYTWRLAKLVGLTGRVHAFEPQPLLAARLMRGVPRHVVVHQVGISDRHATMTLRTPRANGRLRYGYATLEELAAGTDAASLEVKITTLDSFGVSPTFIKVDIEGHEAAMLRGAEETIAQAKPTLLVEIDYRHSGSANRRAALLEWLSDHHYVPHFVTSAGDLRRMGPLNPAQDPNPVDSRYIYNWFFTPDD